MIPEALYTAVYYNTLLAFVLLTAAYLYMAPEQERTPLDLILGLLFLVFIIFYMGLRPVSGIYFGDMGSYATRFREMQRSFSPLADQKGEWAFSEYMYLCSRFMDPGGWFLLTAALYTGLAALAFRLVHKNHAPMALLMFVASFSFWSYGTNGIRNGLGTSLVLLGMACYRRKWLMAVFFCLAFGVHKSTMIPIAAFVLTLFYNRPLTYLVGYICAGILSATMGGWWENAVGNLGLLGDDRALNYLLTAPNEYDFSHIGFRLDFFFYSLWPIAVGSYYIFRKKYQDPFYLQLFNTYIASNALWVLVIRANSSNRIAYLSWFMMAWVIIYPLLKHQLFLRQNRAIAATLLSYFAFTYVMFVRKG